MNANLGKERSFRINAKLAEEELIRPMLYIGPYICSSFQFCYNPCSAHI